MRVWSVLSHWLSAKSVFSWSRACALFAALAPSVVLAADTHDGEAVYKMYCVNCHGLSGNASTQAGRKLKAADLRSDAVQKKTDEQLFSGIAHGIGHKQYPHAFASRGLTDKQINDVLSYIRRFAKSSRNGRRP